MDNDAVIDDIIHEITIIFVSVNAKKSPAIRPVKDTMASCMPKIIADLESNFFTMCKKYHIYSAYSAGKKSTVFC